MMNASDSQYLKIQKLLERKSQLFSEKVDKAYLKKRFEEHKIERKSFWQACKEWFTHRRE